MDIRIEGHYNQLYKYHIFNIKRCQLSTKAKIDEINLLKDKIYNLESSIESNEDEITSTLKYFCDLINSFPEDEMKEAIDTIKELLPERDISEQFKRWENERLEER